ncbi:MAG TPA: HPP family protein [Arsenicitalea sp.]|jgi:CBS-domain-containing membrane protein|nr:HPP family protein [Arsenicitalea sp.]
MRRLKHFLIRHEPTARQLSHFKSAAGATVAMTLVAALSLWAGLPLLLGPLAGTVALIFSYPDSALAQPVNILGGYVLAATMTALLIALWPGHWWLATILVGVVVATMLMLRVTHPPAGAVPVLAMGHPVAPMTLFETILFGAFCLVLIALIHHRLPPRTQYPRRVE